MQFNSLPGEPDEYFENTDAKTSPMISSLLKRKRQIARLPLMMVLITMLFGSGCENTNLFILAEAGYEAVTAVTLSDEDVVNLAGQAAREADARNQVAPPESPYSQRLQDLLAAHVTHEKIPFNFKVYLTDKVNAFAMADGTVRIYSGLMDLMDDRELLFVIGHEMGHVVMEHSRKKVVVAYASSALRKGLAAQENEVGLLARSVVGAFAQQLINAQYSQHEEKHADNFGAEFLISHGYTIDPAVSALRKLATLGGQASLLASHPDPDKRADRLASGAYQDDLEEVSSFFGRIVSTLKTWLAKIIQFLFNLFQ